MKDKKHEYKISGNDLDVTVSNEHFIKFVEGIVSEDDLKNIDFNKIDEIEISRFKEDRPKELDEQSFGSKATSFGCFIIVAVLIYIFGLGLQNFASKYL